MDKIENLGKVIRQIRLKQQLTQTQLAKKAHISNTYLSDIERSVVFPSLHTMEAIALSLHMDTVSLITMANEYDSE